MQRDMLFHTLYEALAPEHCTICHLSLRTVSRSLDGFLYEQVNDPWMRDELIEARGFCPVHGWQLRTVQDSATGTAIVYRHLLEEFYKAFVSRTGQELVSAGGARWLPWATPPNQEAARDIKGWLEPRIPCPACSDQWAAEDRFVSTTLEALPDEDFRKRYEQGLGYCVRHVTSVIERVRQAADLDWLVQTERRLMEQLMHELSEFWRKHDYRFQHEPMTETERICANRVLYKWGGGPGMVWRP